MQDSICLPGPRPHSLIADTGHRSTGYALQGVRELGGSGQGSFLEKVVLGLKEEEEWAELGRWGRGC